MNVFIQTVKALDLPRIQSMAEKKPEWLRYEETDGKNALHYLGGVKVGNDPDKGQRSLTIAEYLLASGLNINGVHRIPDCGNIFPATPLWYAYAKGRNQTLYPWLLAKGADPHHCMFAIAWNDDTEAAALFKHYGAETHRGFDSDTPFLAAWYWKRFHVAEWFLRDGTDVNQPGADGDTALHRAVRKKYDADKITFLLQFGADPHLKNRHGESAIDLAGVVGPRKILRLLQNA